MDSLKITHLDPGEGDAWEQALREEPSAGVFHGAAWARLLRKSYGHTPLYLRLEGAGGAPLLLPLMEVKSALTGTRGVCLPFSDFCPALPEEGAGFLPYLPALLELGRRRGWRHLEFRGGKEPAARFAPSVSYCAHRLHLRRSPASVSSLFANSARRAVRKSREQGVAVRIAGTSEAVLAYYRLHCETRHRHGAPPQSAQFFRHLHAECLAGEGGFVALAEYRERPIAGALFLRRGSAAVYKFGASDSRYQHLRGNNLVMAQAIEHLASVGCDELHFGRTDLENTGLRHFKLLWGSAEEPLHYYRICVRTGQSLRAAGPSRSWASRLFRKLPRTWNRWLGTLLYPHLD